MVGSGGSLIESRGRRPLRETAQSVTGVRLAGVGLAIACSERLRFLPVHAPGRCSGILGAIVLFLYAATRNRRAERPLRPVQEGFEPSTEQGKGKSIRSLLSFSPGRPLFAGRPHRRRICSAKRRILGGSAWRGGVTGSGKGSSTRRCGLGEGVINWGDLRRPGVFDLLGVAWWHPRGWDDR